ncbi:MAG: PmoA family protein [Planctomycetes bacterium]|nr:PmoA family protein [Planctomycetota bacterium]
MLRASHLAAVLAAGALLLLGTGPRAQTQTGATRTGAAPTCEVELRVAEDRPAGPLAALVPARAELAGVRAAAVAGSGRLVQLDAEPDARELSLRTVWGEPLTAGGLALRLAPLAEPPAPFALVAEAGAETVSLRGRPVLRFEHGYDPARAEDTFKVFHHVFALHDDGVLTKGAGGYFSHHRGLFAGWNVTRVAGAERAWDFWHGTGGARQVLRGASHRALGPVCADEEHAIDWIAGDGETLVREVRHLTLWDGGDECRIIDLDIRLQPGGDRPVSLRGDPQHGGVQFRAVDAVHDAEAETRYRRPATAQGTGNDVWTDLGWAIGSFRIRGARYEVLHMTHPANPGRWVYSTRAYGRFGSFAVLELQPGVETRLRFRVIVALAPDDETALLDGDAAWRAFACGECRAP